MAYLRNALMPRTSNTLQTIVTDKIEESRRKSDPNYQLAQKKLETHDRDQNYLLQVQKRKEQRERISNRLNALRLALDAPSPEIAQRIFKEALPGEAEDLDFSFVGRNVTIKYPDGSQISGPRAHVADAAENIAKDPSWLTDPQKASELMTWAASRGISIQMAGEADTSVAQSPLGKLIADRDALPEDDPQRKVYDQAIAQKIAQKGMVIESDGQGGFTIRTNADQTAGEPLSKPAQTEVEKDLLKATYGLSRLNQISQSFKPEYQQLATRWGTAWTGAKEKLGFKPSAEEKQQLADYSAFRRRAINNLNLYIKEITGAQMSEKEAERLKRGMPDPGQGLFGGDSPTAFESKMNDVVAELRVAAARFHYIKRNGMSVNDVALTEMPTIINQRARKIEAMIQDQNPNIAEEDLRLQVRQRLAEEFGLLN